MKRPMRTSKFKTSLEVTNITQFCHPKNPKKIISLKSTTNSKNLTFLLNKKNLKSRRFMKTKTTLIQNTLCTQTIIKESKAFQWMNKLRKSKESKASKTIQKQKLLEFKAQTLITFNFVQDIKIQILRKNTTQ